jgi:hypothetical protein
MSLEDADTYLPPHLVTRLQLSGPAGRRLCWNAQRQGSTTVWVRLVQPAASIVASIARISS